MPKRKDVFRFKWESGTKVSEINIQIQGGYPNSKPAIALYGFSEPMYLEDAERLAVNILKALGSKKLAENAEPKVVYIDPRKSQ